MKPEKTYTIIQHRKGRETVTTRTLPELIKYFYYTLEIGHSWNRKIPLQPKTFKQFLRALEMSCEEKEGACYECTYFTLPDPTYTVVMEPVAAPVPAPVPAPVLDLEEVYRWKPTRKRPAGNLSK